VIGKLDIDCQRRLGTMIEHCFSRTSELPRTLGDALVWHSFAVYPVKEPLYDGILL